MNWKRYVPAFPRSSERTPWSRLLWLLVAVLFHVGLFLGIYQLIVFKPKSAPSDDTVFLRVTIAKQAPPPPPPADQSSTLPEVPDSGASSAPSIAPIIAPNNVTHFTLPKIDSSDVIQHTLDNMQGAHLGNGVADAGDSDNDSHELLGGKISGAARIAVILDQSGSMTVFDKITRTFIEGKYGNAKFYGARNAIGGSRSPDVTAPPDLDSWVQGLGLDDIYKSGETLLTDLYGAIYLSLKDNPEVVVIVTDFEDGYLPESNTDLINTLRKNHIQLVLLSREKAAYADLPAYSRESGGSYSLVKVDEKGASIKSIEPNPKLPESPPLAEVYSLLMKQHVLNRWIVRDSPAQDPYDGTKGIHFIKSEFDFLADATSVFRQATKSQDEQNYRDDFTRQLLLFCAQHPDPSIDPMVKTFIGQINSQILLKTPPNPPDASASHVAQQIIATALQSADPNQLGTIPELIHNTAACTDRITLQPQTNTDQVILTCDANIDGLMSWPPNVAKAITEAALLGEHSTNPQVLAASRYLRFALGDSSGLNLCVADLAKSKDATLQARMLKRISVPDANSGNPLDFLLQHYQNMTFDASQGKWGMASAVVAPATNSVVTPAPPATELKSAQ